jgi:hypothetical protein
MAEMAVEQLALLLLGSCWARALYSIQRCVTLACLERPFRTMLCYTGNS